MNIHYLSDFFIKYADFNQMSLTVHDKIMSIINTNTSSQVFLETCIFY